MSKIVKWNIVPPAGKYGFDTETDKKEYDRKPVLLQFYSPDQGEFILINDLNVMKQINWSKYQVVGHNLYFDFEVMRKEGMMDVFPEVLFDTFIWALLTQEKDKGLKELIVKYFHYSMKHWEDVGSFGLELTPEQIDYACDDAEYAWKLYQKAEFKSDEIIKKLVVFEIGVMKVLVDMSIHGLKFDMEGLMEYKSKISNVVKSEEKILDEMAGWELNTDSPAQLQKYLFTELGLSPVVMTEKGNPSTDEEALSFFSGREIDQVKKVKGLKALNKSLNPKTLKGNSLIENIFTDTAHPQYLQIGFQEASSRIYSTKPSANQIPAEIRQFVVPQKGKKFWYYDLAAAELYVVAKLSGCQVLIDEYESGRDLHTFVSDRILSGIQFDIPEGFTKRDISKVVVFSVVYGSKGAAAARRLKISDSKAEEIINYFFELFPEIGVFQDVVIDDFLATGVAKTAIGRPRKIFGRDGHSQRQSFNHRIQSTLADYCKSFMVKLNAILPKDCSIVIHVFDSFLLETPEEMSEVVVRKYIDESLSGCKMKFNYKLHSGKTWKEAAA